MWVQQKKKIKLKIPAALKRHLITDWDYITKNNSLAPLPRNPCVSEIMDSYLDSLENDNRLIITQEIIVGLKIYFDQALGFFLLYKFERPQFNFWTKMKKKNQQFSDIYGAEHLGRLCVKLPQLFMYNRMQEQETLLLQEELTNFVKWFSSQSDFFTQEYKKVHQDYIDEVNNIVSTG